MVKIEVDPGFRGPTIAELEPVVQDIPDDPLRVRWGGTREETKLLESHGNRNFVLCVAGMEEMGAAAGMLGAALQMEGRILGGGGNALASKKAYNWKTFSEGIGPSATRSLVVKLAVDSVRQGKQPVLARVAADVLLGKASPMDADVLIRLRPARQRLTGEPA